MKELDEDELKQVIGGLNQDTIKLYYAFQSLVTIDNGNSSNDIEPKDRDIAM